MSGEPLVFYYIAGIIVVSSLLTVGLKNPIYCGLSLLVMFLHVAALFILLRAEFLAAVQVIIYAGAILVLYLFLVMMFNLKAEENFLHRQFTLAVIFGLVTLGELLMMYFLSSFSGRPGEFPPDQVVQMGNTQALGLVLFTDYFLPFEIVGILLLGGMIGAIVLAKKTPR